MNKLEFSHQLRSALAGSLNSQVVEEHIQYYQEYIELEMRKGNTEEEVLTMLGNPKLLAKSMIEAGAHETTYHEVNHKHGEESQSKAARPFRWKWIVTLLIIITVLIVVGTLFITLLPYIIVFFVVIQLVKWIVKYLNRS
ncbi:MAG: DUF1700 domain-containing protein [Eubacteriales bacterium]